MKTPMNEIYQVDVDDEVVLLPDDALLALDSPHTDTVDSRPGGDCPGLAVLLEKYCFSFFCNSLFILTQTSLGDRIWVRICADNF